MRYIPILENEKWKIKDQFTGKILKYYTFDERWEAQEWADELNADYENDINNN